ncbi:NUDIX domain-containing protein [Lacibacter luteus]|uniref:NUDIX domain-containing protein n=1 Tax=Lacibacter luteus TaxID=2508719 RepID=A0A4Q1CDJ4_9BACT|nr:NUDIX hydrolase [Lacibacter luteus]RXK57694.1 NUDIX domain-containing protein [Lacibacter luteus]
MTNELMRDITRLLSIADLGLLYHNNEFDKERYEELRAISLRLLSSVSEHTADELHERIPIAKDYPTVKVDIRGLVLSPDKKILLVKESTDGKWSLPGGWADVGYSAKETIIKEIKEETGLDAEVKHLLAVFDKNKHDHPAEPYYVFKLAFYCEALSTTLQKGFDVLDIGYFAINELPELSTNRILKTQLELLYNKVLSNNVESYVD